VITKAYRIVSIRDVDPSDTVLTPSGMITVTTIESDAEGVKLVGKQANDTARRAKPITVPRGGSVVMLADHATLDQIEARICDQLAADDVARGQEVAVEQDADVVRVLLDGRQWTLPRRGYEDTWLTSVLPPPATVPAPKPHPAPPTVAPAGDAKVTMNTVESKGG
jgi:hypothetical protein